MNLAEELRPLQENVGGATIDAPDKYPAWHPAGWASYHHSELLRYWSEARHRIKHDLDRADFIDTKLAGALASFDRREREPSHNPMFDIYNVLNLNALR